MLLCIFKYSHRTGHYFKKQYINTKCVSFQLYNYKICLLSTAYCMYIIYNTVHTVFDFWIYLFYPFRHLLASIHFYTV